MQEKIIEDSVRTYRNYMIKKLYELSLDYIGDNTKLILIGGPSVMNDSPFAVCKTTEKKLLKFEKRINARKQKADFFQKEQWSHYDSDNEDEDDVREINYDIHVLFNNVLENKYNFIKWFETLMAIKRTYYLLDFENRNYYIEYVDKPGSSWDLSLYFGEEQKLYSKKDRFLKTKITI